MYRRIMKFYYLMHIVVCHKKLMCTYITQLRNRHKKNSIAFSPIVLRIFKLLLVIMRHVVLQFLVNRGVLKLLFLIQCQRYQDKNESWCYSIYCISSNASTSNLEFKVNGYFLLLSIFSMCKFFNVWTNWLFVDSVIKYSKTCRLRGTQFCKKKN